MRDTRTLKWAAWSLLCLLGCERSLPIPDAPDCLLRETTFEVAVSNRDAVDLLIVIDVSPSMADEQAALERELPALIRLLVTGTLPDGSDRYPPLRDLRIAVVSADLGTGAGGGAVRGCTDEGADAQLSRGAACGGELGSYADYFVPVPTIHPLVPPPSKEAEEALVQDILCRAQLGSSTCGVSQPLEATLRALRENPEFQRGDSTEGLSALHVLIISDKDDGSPLDDVQDYVDGLRGLRPGLEGLVSLSAIIGLPPGFSNAPPKDVDWRDTRARDAYYAKLLADPLMQPQLATDGTVAPVCESEHARATPAPRIVETVRGLGTNGALQSICEGDWSHALTPLLEGTLSSERTSCWTALPPSRDGLTPCRMLWELPPLELAPRGSPTRCDDLPFLSPFVDRPMSEQGRTLCEVHQLAVEGDGDQRQLEPGGGWFYDDFSDRRGCTCPRRNGRCGEIIFVPNQVPSGVTVRLNCLETSYKLPADAVPDDAGVLHCNDGSCPTGWSCNSENICEPGECRVPG